jgi:hypothetical protein
MTKATKAKTATSAPVLAMTNEMAVKLARGFKTGIKNKTQVTAILTAALDSWINRKEIAARDFILAFWEALNGDKAAVAVVRALMNRLCKRINKENGNENAPALTVKDGELVDVVPRGGNGGGEGEGGTKEKKVKKSKKSKKKKEEVNTSEVKAVKAVKGVKAVKAVKAVAPEKEKKKKRKTRKTLNGKD